MTATLVISIVREGRLWGLIAAHHYSPRNLSWGIADVVRNAVRSARDPDCCDRELCSRASRYPRPPAGAAVDRGDLDRGGLASRPVSQPQNPAHPLDASGAALFCDGVLSTAGEVPLDPGTAQLLEWVHASADNSLFQCSSVGRANPTLDSLTPLASGVVAVKLSTERPDYLMWFRKEQLMTVTWAGDPSKPVIGNDPRELSPRRSFAAWAEIVRGTASPWSSAELALAHAIGTALIDIIVQVNAVRLLIAEHQIAQICSTMSSSAEPVVVANANGKVLFTNQAFLRLADVAREAVTNFEQVADLFVDADQSTQVLTALQTSHHAWRGEMTLKRAGGVPLSVRAEVVPGPEGSVLGFILIMVDLTDRNRGALARQQLEEALSRGSVAPAESSLYAPQQVEPDDVINAILTNASLAAMDIAETSAARAVAPLIEELETSTRRATLLYGRIRGHFAPKH